MKLKPSTITDKTHKKVENMEYRVEKIGPGYYVQRLSVVNFDGILDRDWKDCARFDTEEEANEYIRNNT